MTAEAAVVWRADQRALAVIAAMIAVSFVISSLSAHAELLRISADIPWRHAWVNEGTSHLVLLLLATLLPRVLDRAPLTAGDVWPRTAAIHAGAAALFSLTHVLLMVALRRALFPLLVGYPYEYRVLAAGNLIYEMRKDIFTYALLMFGLYAFREIEHRRTEAKKEAAAARTDGRMTLRSGGASMAVSAADIVSASAAGNYVDVSVDGRTFLARMSLTRLEQLLKQAGNDHIRVHRSHIVNRRRILQVTANGEGGVDIEMANGKVIPGSRRYRDAIFAALPPTAAA